MENGFDFDLSGDENNILDIGEVPNIDPDLEGDVWLLGKMLTRTRVVAGAFRAVMKSLWETRGYTEVRQVGFNLFSFMFETKKEKDLILRSGPWFFDRRMLVLNGFNVNLDQAQIPMTQVPF